MKEIEQLRIQITGMIISSESVQDVEDINIKIDELIELVKKSNQSNIKK